MKTFIAFALMSLSLLSLAQAKTNQELKAQLQDFSTDHCSMFFDGTWADCCIAHDIKYWMGGTEEERTNADEELRQCVGEKDLKALGDMMYLGVRLGGSPLWSTSFKWGYGWVNRQPYKELSSEERREVLQKLYDVDVLPSGDLQGIMFSRELNTFQE